MDAQPLKSEFDRSTSSTHPTLRHTQAPITWTALTAACNNRHPPVAQRLCLWLLLSPDGQRYCCDPAARWVPRISAFSGPWTHPIARGTAASSVLRTRAAAKASRVNTRPAEQRQESTTVRSAVASSVLTTAPAAACVAVAISPGMREGWTTHLSRSRGTP
jgi:hypothetical protein